MKKSLILGSAALALTLSLGASVPTFATTNSNVTADTVPTYAEISNRLAEAKGLGGYSDQRAYEYVSGLVNYTEAWLATIYYSSSDADKREALDALNDAIAVCRLLFTKQTTQQVTAARTIAETPTVTATETTAPVALANEVATPIVSNVVATNPAPAATKSTEVANTDANDNGGLQISVIVHNDQEAAPVEENVSDNTTDDATVATSLTYAATTFSLAGTALVTKRENNRKLHRI